MVTTRPPKTIVKPTALGPVANTGTKLLIYGLFQKGRVLAQDAIRDWADSFGWGTRPLQIENALIAFEVTLFNNAVRISVIQRERLKGFLSIGINIVLSDDQQEQFYDLEQDVADLLVRTLRIEMSRMGMDFSNIDVPLTRVSLEKKLPITGSLAQHEFLSTVAQVNRARILYSETIGLTLNQGNITQ